MVELIGSLLNISPFAWGLVKRAIYLILALAAIFATDVFLDAFSRSQQPLIDSVMDGLRSTATRP